MKKNELVEYIRNPSSLTEEGLKMLESIVAREPYFQCARMLLAKGSKMLKHPSMRKRLSSAALYATDRVLLKKYINGELLFLTRPPEKKPGEKYVKKGSALRRESVRLSNKKRPSVATGASSIKLVIPEASSGHLDAILEELQQDMEALKISRARFANMQRRIKEEETVSEALEKATSAKEKEAKHTLLAIEEIKKKAVEEVTRQEEIKEDRGKVKKPETEETTRYVRRNTLSTELSKVTGETSKKIEGDIWGDTDDADNIRKIKPSKSDAEHKGTEGDIDDNKKDRRSQQEKLIDKFIKENPTVTKSGGAKKTKDDLSGESTSWNEDLASEALAKIYLNQGNKKRGIEIYKTLSLKFPEKGAYFADLISKVE